MVTHPPLQLAKDFELRERTPEERQAAMDAFIASVRNTDDATLAEIDEGIDQMLERIYSTRIPQKALASEDEALSGA
jgi:hypothetical protein